MRRIIRHITSEQSGSSLLTILGITMVIIVIGLIVTTTTMQAFTTTGQTRDSVNASSAAEAGAAVAHAAMDNNTCSHTGGRFTSESEPYYRAMVLYATPGGDYAPGCPTEDHTALIVSTGYADQLGFQNRSGYRRDVEIELEAVPREDAEMPALTAFSSGLGGGGRLVRYDPEIPADMVVLDGDFVCDGGGRTEGDLIVANGGVLAAGGCNVDGSVWVLDDDARCPGSSNPAAAFCTNGGPSILGDVIAYSARLSSGIGGSLYTERNAHLQWGARTDGDIVVRGDLDHNGADRIHGSVWVRGHSNLRQWNVNIDGSLHTGSYSYVGNGEPSVGGSVVVGGSFSGPPAPQQPAVGQWADIGYAPGQWSGRQTVAMSGTCDFPALRSAVDELDGARGIIDARSCTNGIVSGGGQIVTIENDLVIFAERFDLGGGSSIRGPSDAVLHLIQPDTAADNRPTCPYGPETFRMGGGFRFGPGNDPSNWLQVGIYTPCRTEWASDASIRGQVIAGDIRMSGGGVIHYDPVPWPGMASGGGGSDAAPALREILTFRDSPRSAEEHM